MATNLPSSSGRSADRICRSKMSPARAASSSKVRLVVGTVDPLGVLIDLFIISQRELLTLSANGPMPKNKFGKLDDYRHPSASAGKRLLSLPIWQAWQGWPRKRKRRPEGRNPPAAGYFFTESASDHARAEAI